MEIVHSVLVMKNKNNEYECFISRNNNRINLLLEIDSISIDFFTMNISIPISISMLDNSVIKIIMNKIKQKFKCKIFSIKNLT